MKNDRILIRILIQFLVFWIAFLVIVQAAPAKSDTDSLSREAQQRTEDFINKAFTKYFKENSVNTTIKTVKVSHYSMVDSNGTRWTYKMRVSCNGPEAVLEYDDSTAEDVFDGRTELVVATLAHELGHCNGANNKPTRLEIEKEADLIGVQMLVAAGIDPSYTYKKWDCSDTTKNGTHPSMSERCEYVKSYIEGLKK